VEDRCRTWWKPSVRVARRWDGVTKGRWWEDDVTHVRVDAELKTTIRSHHVAGRLGHGIGRQRIERPRHQEIRPSDLGEALLHRALHVADVARAHDLHAPAGTVAPDHAGVTRISAYCANWPALRERHEEAVKSWPRQDPDCITGSRRRNTNLIQREVRRNRQLGYGSIVDEDSNAPTLDVVEARGAARGQIDPVFTTSDAEDRLCAVWGAGETVGHTGARKALTAAAARDSIRTRFVTTAGVGRQLASNALVVERVACVALGSAYRIGSGRPRTQWTLDRSSEYPKIHTTGEGSVCVYREFVELDQLRWSR